MGWVDGGVGVVPDWGELWLDVALGLADWSGEFSWARPCQHGRAHSPMVMAQRITLEATRCGCIDISSVLTMRSNGHEVDLLRAAAHAKRAGS